MKAEVKTCIHGHEKIDGVCRVCRYEGIKRWRAKHPDEARRVDREQKRARRAALKAAPAVRAERHRRLVEKLKLMRMHAVIVQHLTNGVCGSKEALNFNSTTRQKLQMLLFVSSGLF